MKKFRYGFSWSSLVWTFLILFGVGLAAFWLASQIDAPVRWLGLDLESGSASLVVMVIGAFFVAGAGIVASLMFQQRGMEPYILLDKKTLTLPITGRGQVKLPLAEMESWQLVEKSTRKTIQIEHTGRRYRVESRLMPDSEDFEALLKALRAQAGRLERVHGK